jgi:ribosomal protein L32
MLMAVPKAKVTPSRKKRRNQFKRVEFVRDARKCPTCRKPMRSWHNFCCPPKDDEKEDVVYSTTSSFSSSFEGLPGYAPPGVDVMLMAVPKAKVTPSRKKRRNQFKRVEFVRDARKCPTCRKPMRSWHNFCCPPKDDEKEDVVYSTTE